jgi:hypothetical protein
MMRNLINRVIWFGILFICYAIAEHLKECREQKKRIKKRNPETKHYQNLYKKIMSV